jgi:hypothetical protein
MTKEECEISDCSNKPRFNFSGETIALRCSKHRESEMIDIKRKMCAQENCYKRPSFNFQNEKPLFCVKHICQGMVNVISKMCQIKECKKQPIYNFVGENQGKFCKFHALSDMIDIKNKRCEFDECKKQSNYNFAGEKQGKFCKSHALPEMINVISKTCEIKECNIIPIYNFVGEKQGKFCKSHALSDMIDVTNKRCEFDECKKQSNYNFPGEKQGKFCLAHKLPEMVDVVHPKFICSSCHLEWRRQKKTQTLCCYCNPTKTYHTKETQIKKLLEKHNIQNIHDKIFKNEYCLKYRPDFLIDCGKFYLINEVDEFGHVSYPEECEIVRMENISYALGAIKPVKFIRYNPDNKNFTKKHKEKMLIQEIQKYIQMDDVPEDWTPVYLFY